MQLEVDSIVEGKVTGITKFGVFVELAPGLTGMVHISEVAATYVKEIKDFVSENQMVKVKVLAVSGDGRVSLSIKRALPPAPPRSAVKKPLTRPSDDTGPRRQEPLTFEDMMLKFKQASEEKMSTLKKSNESKRGTGRRYSSR